MSSVRPDSSGSLASDYPTEEYLPPVERDIEVNDIPEDEKEADPYEPAEIGHSAFAGERTDHFTVSPHFFSLFLATFHTLSSLAFFLTSLLCIEYYYKNDYRNSAGLIILLHCLKSLVDAIFALQRSTADLPNLILFPLQFLSSLTYLSTLTRYITFLHQWKLHRFHGWNSALRSFGFHSTFCTLPVHYPILMTQIYVLAYKNMHLDDVQRQLLQNPGDSSFLPQSSYTNPILFYEMTPLELIAIIFSFLQCFLTMANYFQYISIHSGVYTTLLIQGTINFSCRIALVCVVFSYIVDYQYPIGLMIACGGTSFALGLAAYWISVYRSIREGKDDPRLDLLRGPDSGDASIVPDSKAQAVKPGPRDRSWYLDHSLFGFFIIAPHLLFFSFPFAPNHSLFSWWSGYILHEWKIQIENILMSAWILYRFRNSHSESLDDPQQTFWSLLGFAAIIVVANVVFTSLLNHHMHIHIRMHGVSSENWVVAFWALRWQRLTAPSGGSVAAIPGSADPAVAPPPGSLPSPIQHRMSVMLNEYYEQPQDIQQELARMDSMAANSNALVTTHHKTPESDADGSEDQGDEEAPPVSPQKNSAAAAGRSPAFDPAGRATFASPASTSAPAQAPAAAAPFATPTSRSRVSPVGAGSPVTLPPLQVSTSTPRSGPAAAPADPPAAAGSPKLTGTALLSQYHQLEAEWQRQMEERKQMKAMISGLSPIKSEETSPAISPPRPIQKVASPGQQGSVSPRVERAQDDE